MLTKMYLRTRLVSKAEYYACHRRAGSIYFIRDTDNDCVKVGHSTDPEKRLQALQVGSSGRLAIIGLVAAPIEIEKHVHWQLYEGRTHGEWFLDRGVTTKWLMDMTQGEPLRRHIWTLVPARQSLSIWHEDTKSHTKHYWGDETKKWEPPISVIETQGISK